MSTWTGYIALGTVDGSGNFTELSAGWYSRQGWTFAAPAGGQVRGITAAVFGPVSGADAVLNAYGFYTSASGGSLVLVYPLANTMVTVCGNSRRVNGSHVLLDIVDFATESGKPLVQSQVSAITGITGGGGGGGGGVSIGTTSGTAADAALTNAALAANATAIAAETTRATGAEGTNATAIAAETTRAIGAEGVNAAAISEIKALGPFRPSPLNGMVPFWYGATLRQALSNGTTDLGGTSRQGYVAPYAMMDVTAIAQNFQTNGGAYNGNGSEVYPAPNPITVSYGYLSSASAIPAPLTSNGRRTVTVQPGGVAAFTAPIETAAGAQCFLQTRVQLALPPTSVAAVAGSASGTITGNVFYKLTTVCGEQGESGPSSEVTLNLGSAGSVALTWALNPLSVAATAINVYKSTASGAETLYMTLPPGTTSWTDTGSVTPAVTPISLTGAVTGNTTGITAPLFPLNVTAITSGTLQVGTNLAWSGGVITIIAFGTGTGGTGTYYVSGTISQISSTTFTGPCPPAAQKFPTGPFLTTNPYPGLPWATGVQGCNYGSVGGNGSDQTLSPLTSWLSSTNEASFTATALLGTPVGGADKPIVLCRGDSIHEGYTVNYGFGLVAQACVSAGIPYHQIARAGSLVTLDALTSKNRMFYAYGASAMMTNFGTNDASNGTSLASIQVSLIADWIDFQNHGVGQIIQCTWLPHTTSVDQMTSTSGQFAQGLAVTGATNATPVVISCSGFHALTDDTPVRLGGIGGNTAANSPVSGNYYVKATGYAQNQFALYQDAGLTIPVAGNGTYAAAVSATASMSGGTMSVPGGATFGVGQILSGGTTPPGTTVLAVNSSTSYAVSTNNTVASTTITGSAGVFDQQIREGIRKAGVLWMRDGCPLVSASNLTAAATGTVGALRAGQTGHPLIAVCDGAALVECAYGTGAATTTPTLNGGFWICDGTAFHYTTEGVHPSLVGQGVIQPAYNAAVARFTAP